MKRAKILVLGGGFAGAFAAKAITRRLRGEASVELVADRNYFVFQPLLPEVVAGTISAADAVTPLRLMLKGIDVRLGEVNDIDFDGRTVELLQGSRRIPQRRSYDHLVIALGQQTNLSRFPGFVEHSFCVRDLAEAHNLRNHVLQCLEHADVTENPDVKRAALTFVVAGAGFSGVEIIGELREMLDRTARYYPNIQPEDIRTLLVQRGQRVLPELSEKLGEYAAEKLRRRGVDIRFGTSLARAVAGAVYTADGERIDTQTLVTTIGNGPNALVARLGLPLARGRIVTEQALNVAGFDNVWALGDAAAIRLPDRNGPTDREAEPKYAPTTAQFAVRQAKRLAENLADRVHNRPVRSEFDYEPRGTMASIGNYRAVAEVFGVRLSGLLAWLLWRGFYLGMLPGLSTKLRVALNWAFDYVLPRSTVMVKTKAQPAVRFEHRAKGDVLFAPEQIVDGFYSIVSGALESRVPSPHGGEDFVRILGPGDHWGERSLSGGFRTQGWLRALEDSELLILPADAFNDLRRGLPVVQQYFDRIPAQIYPELVRARERDGDTTG